MKPSLTIFTAYNELDRMASCPILSDEAREAARRASELLCAVRSSLDLSWDHSAADLYKIGYSVAIREEA